MWKPVSFELLYVRIHVQRKEGERKRKVSFFDIKLRKIQKDSQQTKQNQPNNQQPPQNF